MLPGPVGALEALLEEPEEGEPQEAALVCHPHPQHGGTLHNKVVYRIARGLRRSGAVVLRFNYRGVNRSEGSFAQGEGELEDARVALAWLRQRYPDLPYSLAGFSFGSRIVMRLGCELADVRRVIAVGFPTYYATPESVFTCAANKLFVHSTQDQYGPKGDLEAIYARLPEPKQLHWVQAEDHFFKGALDEFEKTIAALP